MAHDTSARSGRTQRGLAVTVVAACFAALVTIASGASADPGGPLDETHRRAPVAHPRLASSLQDDAGAPNPASRRRADADGARGTTHVISDPAGYFIDPADVQLPPP